MNEEYLWSKKGTDPEIEKFESLLMEFRVEEAQSPAFVLEAAPKESGVFSKRIGWIFGLAAPSFALALFAFWLFTPNSIGDLRARIAATDVRTAASRDDTDARTPSTIAFEANTTKSLAPLRRNRPAIVKTVYRSRKPTVDRYDTLTAVKLTSEEKYAYERLRLALSIAGAKLKVVQDTIDRSGDLEKRSIRNEK